MKFGVCRHKYHYTVYSEIHYDCKVQEIFLLSSSRPSQWRLQSPAWPDTNVLIFSISLHLVLSQRLSQWHMKLLQVTMHSQQNAQWLITTHDEFYCTVSGWVNVNPCPHDHLIWDMTTDTPLQNESYSDANNSICVLWRVQGASDAKIASANWCGLTFFHFEEQITWIDWFQVNGIHSVYVTSEFNFIVIIFLTDYYS